MPVGGYCKFGEVTALNTTKQHTCTMRYGALHAITQKAKLLTRHVYYMLCMTYYVIPGAWGITRYIPVLPLHDISYVCLLLKY